MKHDNTLKHVSLILLSLSVVLAAGFEQFRSIALDWYTVDGGGDMRLTGGSLELSGTIGQPDTDSSLTMNGPTLSLTGGFWAGVPETVSVPGDCTGDRVVDLDDFELIAPCLTGPGIIITVDCDCADLDGDDDSDLADFAVFQRTLDSQEDRRGVYRADVPLPTEFIAT